MKTAFLHIRIDELLKDAIEISAKNNHIDASSMIRLALANYPPIKAVLDELKEQEGDE